MDLNALLAECQQAADAHAQAVIAYAEARVGKAEAKLALDAARNAIILSLDTPDGPTTKEYGPNQEQRQARLDADTADLAAALRDAERAALYADADERQAAIRAEHVGQRVRIAAMLARA